MADTHQVGVEPECLRARVRDKYRVFATDPGAGPSTVCSWKCPCVRAVPPSLHPSWWPPTPVSDPSHHRTH
jgi:hypothetical protein